MQHLIAQILPTSVPNTVDVDISAAAGITTGSTTSSIGILSLGKVIETGAGAILSIGGLATFVYLLMGAFNWVTAGGDKSKIETARAMITQAIIGLAVLASVFALFGILTRFFGIQDKIDVGIYGAGGSSSGGGRNNCSNYNFNDCPKHSECKWNAPDITHPDRGNCIPAGGGASCTVGTKYNDGGSGHYCTNGGAADVICVKAGDGVAHLNYIHYEPYCCKKPNVPLSGYTFMGNPTTCP